MIDKTKAPAGAGTPTEARQETASGRATISMFDSTANDTPRQPHGKIFDLLPVGEENALPARDLATVTGLSPRGLRRAIDAERERGLPVLASDSGYYRPAEGPEGVRELRAFLRRQDCRMRSNRRVVAPLRRMLKTLERAPLDGQKSLFVDGEGGGDDDG